MEVLWMSCILLAVLVRWLTRRPPPEQDLTGKVVLLTGAGGGFGRMLSLCLARRGCSVACVDVFSATNEETVGLLQQQDKKGERRARAYTADLSKREDVAALVSKVIEDFGHVDILVSNAGQLQGGAVWDMTEDQLDMVLDVNLRATMLLVRALVPHMRARRTGHIVAVSSMGGIIAMGQSTAYLASKAGLTHFMDCLYHDLQHEGLHKYIHVTNIQPSFMSSYGQLTHALKITGPLNFLFRFLNPKKVAEHAAAGIAARRDVITIPENMIGGAQLYRVLPRRLQSFVINYLVTVDVRAPLPYQYRHQAMDAAMMYELLSKGYPLEQDPTPACRELCDKHSAEGVDLPRDYAPFSSSVESFYTSRHQAVPDVVKRVFGL